MHPSMNSQAQAMNRAVQPRPRPNQLTVFRQP
jgi:hypothetical protein